MFGGFDGEAAEAARRTRFLLRRSDPEFLEVMKVPVPVAEPALVAVEPPPSLPRRSRRVRGLDAEFEEVVRVARRRRLS